MQNPLTNEQREKFEKEHGFKKGDSYKITDAKGVQCKYTVGSDVVINVVNLLFDESTSQVKRLL